MIVLYGNGSPNVVKLIIMFEELGLDWELRPIDVMRGEQFGPELQALTPNGRIPVMIDDGVSGPPVTIFESNASLIHLAETRGRLLPAEPSARADVLQWLMFQTSGVGPMFGQYIHFVRFAPPGADYAQARYGNETRRLCAVLDRHLASRTHIATDYSIADIAIYPWPRFFVGGLVDRESVPNLARWIAAMEERPAVRRALARLEPIWEADRLSAELATPADLDRLFNRTRGQE
jgi:GST-like protein